MCELGLVVGASCWALETLVRECGGYGFASVLEEQIWVRHRLTG